MTTKTTTQHNEEIRKQNVIATTTATFNSKQTGEATISVSSTISKEGSMFMKTMQDYIEKRIK